MQQHLGMNAISLHIWLIVSETVFCYYFSNTLAISNGTIELWDALSKPVKYYLKDIKPLIQVWFEAFRTARVQ